MKTKGIRITDSGNGFLDVSLSDILTEISEGIFLNWCILFLDGTPNSGEGRVISEYKDRINKSDEGLFLDWNELNCIALKFYQIFEITILGSNKKEFLHRYKSDQEMYETCDFVIELIDCAFWQVFTKENDLIERLKIKFEETELLDPNFEK